MLPRHACLLEQEAGVWDSLASPMSSSESLTLGLLLTCLHRSDHHKGQEVQGALAVFKLFLQLFCGRQSACLAQHLVLVHTRNPYQPLRRFTVQARAQWLAFTARAPNPHGKTTDDQSDILQTQPTAPMRTTGKPRLSTASSTARTLAPDLMSTLQQPRRSPPPR